MKNETSNGPAPSFRKRYVIWLLCILAVSVGVRAGTGYFLAQHLDDAGWFQKGSYSIFHDRAVNISEGREPIFFFSDADRTDLVQYPPGFPLLVAAIYNFSSERSAYAVLRVQWLLDALITPLLILGIAVSTFGWGTPAKVAGIFSALSPMLAFYGVTPTAEAVTTWLVLAAIWILLAAYKRPGWRLYLLAGIVLGGACWFRVNPLFLVFVWAAAGLVWAAPYLKARLRNGLILVVGSVLVVAPIVIRNVVVFDEFMLTGLSVGTTLWEGLGETEFGRSLGFRCSDDLLIEAEREKLGYSPDLAVTLAWPDGIRRDRERARRALDVIRQYPVWYAGVMSMRMWWMLKIAGAPGPYYGTSGINCTREKCLPQARRDSPLAFVVDVVGSGQSVYRYAAMFLAAVGVWFGFRQNKKASLLLLATVLYYLIPGTAAHTELRYMLPMHAVLVVFSGVGLAGLISSVLRGVGIGIGPARSSDQEEGTKRQRHLTTARECSTST